MKKTGKYILCCFLFLCLFSAAFAQDKKNEKTTADTNLLLDYQTAYFSQVFGFSVCELFNSRLYDTISEWLGTPYRYAGKQPDGIDCSGFVNMIYKNVYGVFLNGTSLDLYKACRHLKKNKLEEGDLVFFKIHRKQVSHVGVYLGDDKFAHSSVSNGVIVSDLNEPYYKKYFAGGGRVGWEHKNE